MLPGAFLPAAGAAALLTVGDGAAAAVLAGAGFVLAAVRLLGRPAVLPAAVLAAEELAGLVLAFVAGTFFLGASLTLLLTAAAATPAATPATPAATPTAAMPPPPKLSDVWSAVCLFFSVSFDIAAMASFTIFVTSSTCSKEVSAWTSSIGSFFSGSSASSSLFINSGSAASSTVFTSLASLAFSDALAIVSIELFSEPSLMTKPEFW